VVKSITSSMFISVATTTLNLKDCGLYSVRVMVGVFEHPRGELQGLWLC